MNEHLHKIEREVEVTMKHLLEVLQSLYIQSRNHIEENKELKRQLQVFKKHGQKKTRINR